MEITEKNGDMSDISREICVRVAQKSRESTECARDFILPDMYADIKRIISYSGSLSPESSFVDAGKALYSGTLSIKLLFVDDESNLRSVSFSQDYSGNVSLSDDDGYGDYTVMSTPVLENISVRMANPRKISVRGRIDPSLKIWKKISTTPEGTEIRGTFGEECEMRSESELFMYPFTLFCGDLELSEDIRLDQPLKNLIFWDVSAEAAACSYDNGRLSVKGVLTLDMIGSYADRDDVKCIRKTVDFSQSVEANLPENIEDLTCGAHLYIRSADLSLAGEGVDENNKVEIDLGYTVVFSCVCERKAMYVSDAYIPTRSAELKTDAVMISALPKKISKLVRIEACNEGSLPEDSRILLVQAVPHIDSVTVREGVGYALGDSQISVSYSDPGGLVSSVSYTTELEVELGEIDAFDEYLITKKVSSVSARNENGALCVGYDLEASFVGWKNNEENIVSAINVTDGEKNVERKAFTLCYPASGEKLWDIGKKYGVSIDLIRRSNRSLEEDPTHLPSVLLIPSKNKTKNA